MLFIMSLLVSTGYNPDNRPNPEVDHVDFVVAHTGATPFNIENNNSFYKFSTSFNDEYIMTKGNSLQYCQTFCKGATKCLGFVHYYDDKNNERCNTLSNLGDVSETKVNVTSYKKILYYKNNDDHSILGQYIDTYSTTRKVNHTLYIDLNRNGIYDNNEPLTFTDENNTFIFENISVGNYLVREIQNDNCIQLIPGIIGANTVIRGGGYVDNVVEYYHDGHNENAHFSGGVIKNDGTYESRKDVGFMNVLNKRSNL